MLKTYYQKDIKQYITSNHPLNEITYFFDFHYHTYNEYIVKYNIDIGNVLFDYCYYLLYIFYRKDINCDEYMCVELYFDILEYIITPDIDECNIVEMKDIIKNNVIKKIKKLNNKITRLIIFNSFDKFRKKNIPNTKGGYFPNIHSSIIKY